MTYSHCSNSDIRYVELAATEAYKSTVNYRHGCIAVSSGKVIARGHNHDRTISRDGLISNNVCSCHAEIDVLRKCLRMNRTKKPGCTARPGNHSFWELGYRPTRQPRGWSDSVRGQTWELFPPPAD